MGDYQLTIGPAPLLYTRPDTGATHHHPPHLQVGLVDFAMIAFAENNNTNSRWTYQSTHMRRAKRAFSVRADSRTVRQPHSHQFRSQEPDDVPDERDKFGLKKIVTIDTLLSTRSWKSRNLPRRKKMLVWSPCSRLRAQSTSHTLESHIPVRPTSSYPPPGRRSRSDFRRMTVHIFRCSWFALPAGSIRKAVSHMICGLVSLHSLET